MSSSPLNRRTAFGIALALVAPLLLACIGLDGLVGGTTALTTSSQRTPAWACPSPTPKPHGRSGNIKREWEEPIIDPVTGLVTGYETFREYYDIWEQEYGPRGSLLAGNPPHGGSPFPAPTPYTMQGTRYVFGQRVRIDPLFVEINVRTGPARGSGMQTYVVELSWHNPTTQTVQIGYPDALALTGVTLPSGGVQSGTWNAVQDVDAPVLPTRITPGENRHSIPVVAPVGQPQAVALTVAWGAAPVNPVATPAAGVAMPVSGALTVAWVNSALRIGPPCADAGAMTPWDTSDAWGAAAAPLTPVAGQARVIQIAHNQVGKPYVWGAQGPEMFDCSGLMMWSYNQIGVRIPRTTATQWPGLRPVPRGHWVAGDLVYMDTTEAGRSGARTVTHVGMLADLDHDGRWDLIHAASPKFGVRIEMDFLASVYYGPRTFSDGRAAQ